MLAHQRRGERVEALLEPLVLQPSSIAKRQYSRGRRVRRFVFAALEIRLRRDRPSCCQKDEDEQRAHPKRSFFFIFAALGGIVTVVTLRQSVFDQEKLRNGT
jgi:hypothetical protein